MRPSIVVRGPGWRPSGTVRQVIAQHIANRGTGADKANAPKTLPLQIDLTSRPELSRVQNFLSQGKSIVKLYKEGIKNVYHNIKESREIRKRYGVSNLKELTSRIVDNAQLQSIQWTAKAVTPGTEHITRQEYQTIIRTTKDAKKLPIFALVFAIFFEMTPIIVLIFPGIVPRTCVLPSHEQKVARALDERVQALKSSFGYSEDELSEDELVKAFSRSPQRLTEEELKQVCNLFFPVRFHSQSGLQRRLEDHMNYIRADNILLSRFGSVWALDDSELRLACLDRAIAVGNKSVDQLRTELLVWIARFEGDNYDSGFLLQNTVVSDTEGLLEAAPECT